MTTDTATDYKSLRNYPWRENLSMVLYHIPGWPVGLVAWYLLGVWLAQQGESLLGADTYLIGLLAGGMALTSVFKFGIQMRARNANALAGAVMIAAIAILHFTAPYAKVAPNTLYVTWDGQIHGQGGLVRRGFFRITGQEFPLEQKLTHTYERSAQVDGTDINIPLETVLTYSIKYRPGNPLYAQLREVVHSRGPSDLRRGMMGRAYESIIDRVSIEKSPLSYKGKKVSGVQPWVAIWLSEVETSVKS